MKVPLSWLKEYVDIDLPLDEYQSRMVMSGTGIEGIETQSEEISGVVVGRVVELVKHPNADNLSALRVDVGAAEGVSIVTGARNVAVGDLVPVALDGALLPGGKRIERGTLRGVLSEGMLCSGAELGIPEGLHAHCGEQGIMLLPAGLTPGADIRDALNMHDEIIDFDILANRPDCQCVWGVARETAAVLGTHFTMPIVEMPGASDEVLRYAGVEVRDSALCPRYVGRVVRDVRIAPSPLWMRAHLYAAGIRPINNIVDITNYIMLETGHPMHAFDLSRVPGGKIVVRRAYAGESLVTLDGKARTLTPDMLVIADGERATGLAGIMGGEHSEISDDTCTVLFECAAFDRANVRVTSRTLGLRTESSGRFEKGVCADTALLAMQRACQLVADMGAGEIVPGAIDVYPEPMRPRTVTASVSRITRLIGVELPGSAMVDILDRLELDARADGDVLTVTAPPLRGDIENDADIAEEVLRLHGYRHIPSRLMQGEVMPGGRGARRTQIDALKRQLVAMGGYEIATYSFISPRWVENLGLPEGDVRLSPVQIRNPLGLDTSVMRTTLVPSMLSTLAVNISRGNAGALLFEMGPRFLPSDRELPDEPLTLCAALFGANADFYKLKDVACCLLTSLGLTPGALPGGDGYYHPGRKAMLYADGRQVGEMGEIHPETARRFDIAGRVYVLELDIDALLRLAKPMGHVVPLPKYQAVARDLAFTVPEGQPVGPMVEMMRRAGAPLAQEVQVFDIYRNALLGGDKKSVAFTVTLRAEDHTLVDEEITAVVGDIITRMRREFGAELRG